MILKRKVFAVVLAVLFAGLFAATAMASRSTDKGDGDADVSFAVNSEPVGEVVLVRRSGGGRGGHSGGRGHGGGRSFGRSGGRGHGGGHSFGRSSGRGHGGGRSFGRSSGRGHGGGRSFAPRGGRSHGGRRSFGHSPSHRGRRSSSFRGRHHSRGHGLHNRPHSGFGKHQRFRHHGRHNRHHGFGLHFFYPFYGSYYYYPYGYYYDPYGRYYFDSYYDYPRRYYYGPGYESKYYQENQPAYDDKGAKLDTYDDVREKIERQRAAEEAKVHDQLERIGEQFRAGDYPEALKRATDAINADADNAILGFAYTQSLFANGHYDRAADALRQAIQNVDMKTQGVLFGADFYPDGEVFKGKIEQLIVAAGAEPDDNDLQLLLGYQLMAAKRYDAAAEALEKTRRDYINRQAAGLLVNVLDQLQRSEKKAGE